MSVVVVIEENDLVKLLGKHKWFCILNNLHFSKNQVSILQSKLECSLQFGATALISLLIG